MALIYKEAEWNSKIETFAIQACVTVVTSLKSRSQRCEWNRSLHCVKKANKKVSSASPEN